MSKHAPGPWKATTKSTAKKLSVEVSSGYNHVATITYLEHGNDFDPRGVHYEHTVRRLANAQLMLAAPELLTALERLLSIPNVRLEADTEALRQAFLAIDKATAEQARPSPFAPPLRRRVVADEPDESEGQA